MLRRRILPIDLRKIAKSIDQGQSHCSSLSGHIAESRRSVRQRAAIRRPEASGHDHQEGVPSLEAIDQTYDDGTNQRANKPTRDNKTTLFRELVAKVTSRYDAYEGDGVDGDNHELRIYCAVPKTCYQCGVEVR